MGWSSGSGLFCDLLDTIKLYVKNEETRRFIYLDMLESFENADWDCPDEALGIDPAYDKIYKEKYPDDDWDAGEDDRLNLENSIGI